MSGAAHDWGDPDEVQPGSFQMSDMIENISDIVKGTASKLGRLKSQEERTHDMRREVWGNDFVITTPKNPPNKEEATKDEDEATEALAKLSMKDVDKNKAEAIQKKVSEQKEKEKQDSIPKEPEFSKVDIPDAVGLGKLLAEEKFKRILVVSGAGLSVSAGIPDFRTPGTGLYDNLEKYNLPYPEAIFTMDFFNTDPSPFFLLSKELMPGKFKPTLGHFFIRMLHDRGLLLRAYTQNIDTLEREAGVPGDRVIEAHGSFATATCQTRKCRCKVELKDIRDRVLSGEIPRCNECKEEGVLKPDIVFFGESLPERFFNNVDRDVDEADLVIVMGTSLAVAPVCMLPTMVDRMVPRVLINLEMVGDFQSRTNPRNYRDISLITQCDEAVMEICKGAGWHNELQQLYDDHELADLGTKL
eukprot:Clim_evm16s238 gene=Clim_evmTU16s238